MFYCKQVNLALRSDTNKRGSRRYCPSHCFSALALWNVLLAQLLLVQVSFINTQEAVWRCQAGAERSPGYQEVQGLNISLDNSLILQVSIQVPCAASRFCCFCKCWESAGLRGPLGHHTPSLLFPSRKVHFPSMSTNINAWSCGDARKGSAGGLRCLGSSHLKGFL